MLFSAAASRQPIQFGAYLLTECVGQGGMAVVYKATKPGPSGFEKTVVVKAMLPTLSGQREFVTMFSHEARLMAALTHPNIVQVHDFGLVDGIPYLAMEYLPGRNLSQLRAALSARGQRLPVGAALAIARDMCHGLGYAHDFVDGDGRRCQVIHRDVSPSNVMVCRDGSVKLLDFGVAKIVGEFDFDVTQSFKGKYAYMSPEQVNHQPIDRRVDVFAAGVILHELLTGKRLFAAGTELETLQRVSKAQVVAPSVDNREVPRALDAIVKKALARDPKDRYGSGGELAEALETLDSLAWPRKRLAAFVAEIFADDWMIVCEVCGKQVVQGEECGECGTAAPASPAPKPDPDARAVSARQALMPLLASMHGENTDKHELPAADAAPPAASQQRGSEPLPLPPPPQVARKQALRNSGRANLSVVRTPLPPPKEPTGDETVQAKKLAPQPPVEVAGETTQETGLPSLAETEAPTTLPNIVLSPELQTFAAQPVPTDEPTQILPHNQAKPDPADTIVDHKRPSRPPAGPPPMGPSPLAQSPLGPPRLFVVPQPPPTGERTPAMTPLPPPFQSPLSTPRPVEPRPLFVVPPTPAPAQGSRAYRLKQPSRLRWWVLGAIAVAMVVAIATSGSPTPETTQPVAQPTVSAPQAAPVVTAPAVAAPKPAPVVAAPKSVVAVSAPAPTPPPAVAAAGPTPPRVVRKPAPPRHRVVRPRPVAADDADAAPTSTVKEGRIVDPFAGIK